jgi:hypothetical protein
MPKRPNIKLNYNGNKDNKNNYNNNNHRDNNEILRRGCYIKKFTKYIAKVPFKGGRSGEGAGGEGSLFPVVQE